VTDSKALRQWVEETAAWTEPERVVWCDGSTAEKERLVAEMLGTGALHALNPDAYPACYLHRSDPNDVARTEHLTFICSERKDDAGPTNNWMSPADAEAKVKPLFRGAMKGRTMYVVPYLMGPVGSPFAKVGVEVTDSAYVVVNMGIMTRMGRPALQQLGAGSEFV
jgi:phosphoenolpyruvate carboxykinase (GTP)